MPSRPTETPAARATTPLRTALLYLLFAIAWIVATDLLAIRLAEDVITSYSIHYTKLYDDDRPQNASVGLIQTELIDLEHPQRLGGHGLGDPPVGAHLGEIADPPQ